MSELRTAFVHAVRTAGRPVTQAAKGFNISRKTAYPWLARFGARPPRVDTSRRPALGDLGELGTQHVGLGTGKRDTGDALVLVFKTVKQAVTRFAFSADGSRVAAAGTGKKVHVWNLTVAKHKRAALAGLADPVMFLVFRPDGKLLAVSRFGQALVHDPAAGTSEVLAPDTYGWVSGVVAAPDCSAFYNTGHLATKWVFDNGLRRAWEERVPGYPTQHGIGGGAIAPTGEYLAAVFRYRTASAGSELHTRDPATGALLATVPLGAGAVRDLTLFADGRTLAFLRYERADETELVTGPLEGPFEVVRTGGETDLFTALAPHPSGRWLAVGQQNGLVRVLDTHDWSEVTAYRWTEERVHAVAFAPDGLKAAAGFGTEGKFVVWDVDL